MKVLVINCGSSSIKYQLFEMDQDQSLVTIRALNAITILPSILERMESKGLHPGDVRVRENTLEDVFIQLTGRRLRE